MSGTLFRDILELRFFGNLGTSKKAFIFLLSLMVMVSVAQTEVNHIPLATNGNVIENEINDRGIQYYKIKFGEGYEQGKDLMITIKGLDSNSDPDLYISSTNETPNSYSDSEYRCTLNGEDICTVPSSALSNGSILYVGAKCYQSCHYSINAVLVNEIKVYPATDVQFSAKAGESKIFSFTNAYSTVKNIYITARTESSSKKLDMYVASGADNTPTTQDMRSTDSWDNGSIIKLSNSTLVKIKGEETYKVLVEAKNDLNATLRIDLTYHDKEITEGEVYEDFVYYLDHSCYKYDVKTSDKKVRIGVYSYSGDPNIYATSDENETDLEKFEFNATEGTDDVLVLTPEDRAKAGQKKGWYRICVSGRTTTSFKMRLVESNEQYFLEDGISETNEIESGKTMMLYYTDDALIRDQKISFLLSVKSGSAPTMRAKFWGRVSDENCTIDNTTDSSVVSSNEHNLVSIVIDHEGKKWEKDSQTSSLPCIYGIQIEAPSHWLSSMNHFSILAYHHETTHFNLREGESLDQVVENHQYLYYKFVVRDPKATKVIFTLTSNHGDADMFISQSEKFPDTKNSERRSMKGSKFVDEIVFEKESDSSLLGVYYIGVQGYQYASFTLRASVERKGETEEETLVVPFLLKEGVTQNEYIYGADGKKYFHFWTSMNDETASDVRISVVESVGQFKYYVKLWSQPTVDDYDLKSEDWSDVVFRQTDEKFKHLLHFFVMVVPVKRYGRDIPAISRFSINYKLLKTMHQIREEVPQHGTVQIGAYTYFQYHYLDTSSDLTISLTPLSGDSNLVVSLDSENVQPKIGENDFESVNTGRKYITIPADRLAENEENCYPLSLSSGNEAWEIYIGVHWTDRTTTYETNTNDSCSFSLKVYQNVGNMHLLFDGAPQKDHVTRNGMIFYYMPVDKETGELYVAANVHFGDIEVRTYFFDQTEKSFIPESVPDLEYAKMSKGVSHSKLVHFNNTEIIANCEEFDE